MKVSSPRSEHPFSLMAGSRVYDLHGRGVPVALLCGSSDPAGASPHPVIALIERSRGMNGQRDKQPIREGAEVWDERGATTMLDADLDEEPAATSEEERSAEMLSDDSIPRYLHQIGHIPLLNAAEEVALAERIERGEAAARRLAQPERLSPTLRAALEADIAEGQAARHQLVQANLRLVVSIAKRYVGHGLALQDLIQEGSVGLMRAATKFDHHKGNRFSTYATWWIRQAIIRALGDQSRTIRLPVHLGEAIGKVRRISERLEQTLGRAPTTEEIAAALGQPAERIAYILAAGRRPLSLETPVGADGDRTLGELLPSEGAPAPLDLAARQLLRRDLAAALVQLNERERRIIELRYGLRDGRWRTLEEVGRALGMTRERVRQIEAVVLRRLRDQDTARHLQDYLE
jgi:RNA polymerase primary sigma factor